MKKNVKASKKVFGSILMAALAAGAFATPVETSSAGQFSGDADKIVNTTEWSKVEFEKFLLSADFDASNLNVTGAFKIGDIVIAPAYKGNIFKDWDKTTDKKTVTGTVDGAGALVSKTVTDEYSDQNEGNNAFTNKPSVLVGFGNIGIKAGVDLSNDSKDSQSTTTTTKKDAAGNVVKDTFGSVTVTEKTVESTDVVKPYIGAGAVFEINDMTLKPYASFDFKMDMQKKSAKSTVSTKANTLYGFKETITETKKDQNIYTLSPVVGATLEIPSEKFTNVLQAQYSGDFNIYNTSINNAFGKAQKLGTYNDDPTVVTETTKAAYGVSNTKTTVTADGFDNSKIVNGGLLSYKAYAPLTDQLTVTAGTGVNLSFTSEKSAAKKYTTVKSVSTDTYGTVTSTSETTTTVEGQVKDVFTTVVRPSLDVAAEYAVVPNKFVVRCGAYVTLPTLTYTNTTTVDTNNGNADNKKTTVESKTTDNLNNVTSNKTVSNYNNTVTGTTKEATWSGVSANMMAGFSWFMSENFIVDTALVINGQYGTGSVFSSSLAAGATLKF